LITLRTFGGLAIDGAKLSESGVTRRRPLALLALLAVAGERGVSRDKLIAYLWPESDAERARNSLSQALSSLRREGGNEIVLGSTELRLNPERITSDVGEFLRLVAAGDHEPAVALYSGPFLDGVFLSGAPEFERWVDEQRRRLEDLQASAVETLAVRASARGDAAGAVQLWRQRAQLDPLDARAAHCLVEALAATGDVAAALKHVRAHQALIAEELGIQPDERLVRLAERLRKSGGASIAADASGAPLNAAANEPSGAPPLDAESLPPGGTLIDGRRLKRWRVRLGMAVTALLLAFGIGVASLVARNRARSDLVIVTPFENQTGDTSLNNLGLVLASSLTQALAATGRLSVGDFQTVLTTMPRYRSGNQLDPVQATDVARKSGAGWVVRGSFRTRGDSLVLSTRIVREPEDEVAAALDPITVAQKSEARLLEEARQAVVGAMAALHDAAWAPLTGRLPRYDAEVEYTLGLEALSFGDRAMAEQHFKRSAELDTLFVAPIFALGSGLSDSMLAALSAKRDRLSQIDQLKVEMIAAQRRDQPEAAYQWAERHAGLTPDDPNALLDVAYEAYLTNRYARSIDAFHAVHRFPPWFPRGQFVRDINAHHMAGDFNGALREARESHVREPRVWMYCSKIIEQDGALGRVDEAENVIASCQGAPDAPTDLGFPFFMLGQELQAHGHSVDGQRALARCVALRLDYAARHSDGGGGSVGPASQCYFEGGDWKNAYTQLRNDISQYGNPAKAHMMLGIAAAHVGDTATAREMLRWHELRTPSNSDHLWYRAGILLALDRRDDAIELLRQAVNSGSPAIMTHINNVRAFLPLHGDPRFDTLVAPRR
jgi:DNA-binding SARP family transcriptional activator/TolB-like protein